MVVTPPRLLHATHAKVWSELPKLPAVICLPASQVHDITNTQIIQENGNLAGFNTFNSRLAVLSVSLICCVLINYLEIFLHYWVNEK